MSIESLKEQARTHEQKEEWAKAVDLYRKAIAKLEEEDQPDIGLYNRVADLQVRQGQLEEAVKNYEKAIELYVESELPNNAIAVCKKIVRNMPMRHTVYLRMGQIRGLQGFVSEARLNFLTYAERMQSAGNIDEGLRALGELADLAPEDVEIRLAIAGQMQSHGRKDDAIAQLQTGYRAASLRGLPTGPFETMLEQLGSSPSAQPQPTAAAGDEDELGGFGEIMLAGGDAETEKPEAEAEEDELGGFGEIVIGGIAQEDEEEEEGAEESEPLPMFVFGDEEEEEEEGEDAGELPLLGGYEADAEEEEVEPLPLLGDGFSAMKSEADLDASAFGEREEREGEYAGVEDGAPEIEIGEVTLEASEPAEARESAMEEARAEAEPAREPEVEPLIEPTRPPLEISPPSETPALSRQGVVPEGMAPRPQRPGGPERDPMGHESLAARGDVQGAMTALRKLVRNTPNDVALRQRMVEYAARLDDRAQMVAPWIELAETYERLHQPERARPLFEQVLAVDAQNARALEGLGQKPAAAASGGDFVDLGSFLLDDDEEKTTRFVVAYEEPSGDEQADFAKMLSQFKAKVAENLGADDVKAHLDLGTAYKEMGLVNEAISEFQQALRASAAYLPAYELLGQCFMEKGEPDAAVRTLKRALDMPFEVEDELLGIYYWLGRAHQQLGNKSDAVEFYDRVFSLDINFADVTERLRALR